MDNPLHAAGGSGGASHVPVWVWLLVGVVVLMALMSHTASTTSTPATETVSNNTSDATAQLQAMQLQAQTAIASAVLNIAGAEDIARIQARTQEVYGNQQLAAIEAQAKGNVAQIQAQNPPAPVNIVITKQNASASALAFRTDSATAMANVRGARMTLLNSVAGAIGQGVHYAQGIF
jgi:hypothetical protein